MNTVIYATPKVARELSKVWAQPAGLEHDRVLLVDGTIAHVNQQNGDGETAYYRLAYDGRWITASSIEKFL